MGWQAWLSLISCAILGGVILVCAFAVVYSLISDWRWNRAHPGRE